MAQGPAPIGWRDLPIELRARIASLTASDLDAVRLNAADRLLYFQERGGPEGDFIYQLAGSICQTQGPFFKGMWVVLTVTDLDQDRMEYRIAGHPTRPGDNVILDMGDFQTLTSSPLIPASPSRIVIQHHHLYPLPRASVIQFFRGASRRSRFRLHWCLARSWDQISSHEALNTKGFFITQSAEVHRELAP